MVLVIIHAISCYENRRTSIFFFTTHQYLLSFNNFLCKLCVVWPNNSLSYNVILKVMCIHYTIRNCGAHPSRSFGSWVWDGVLFKPNFKPDLKFTFIRFDHRFWPQVEFKKFGDDPSEKTMLLVRIKLEIRLWTYNTIWINELN